MVAERELFPLISTSFPLPTLFQIHPGSGGCLTQVSSLSSSSMWEATHMPEIGGFRRKPSGIGEVKSDVWEFAVTLRVANEPKFALV